MRRDATVANYLLQLSTHFKGSIHSLSPGLRLLAYCCMWGLDGFCDLNAAKFSTTCSELLHLWNDEHLLTNGSGKAHDELLFCLNVLASEDDPFSQCSSDLKDCLKRFIDDVLHATQEKLISDTCCITHTSKEPHPDNSNVADIISERESDKKEARRNQLLDIRGAAKRLLSLMEGLSDKVH